MKKWLLLFFPLVFANFIPQSSFYQHPKRDKTIVVPDNVERKALYRFDGFLKSFDNDEPPRNLHHLCSKLCKIRGGYSYSKTSALFLTNPANLYNFLLLTLSVATIIWKLFTSNWWDGAIVRPVKVKSLQRKFLLVFWLMRMADWLQGPYFYEVYSSKIISGSAVSFDLISKIFLVGFASTGLFGPWIGRFIDTVGRKAGTILFSLLYMLAAMSTKSSNLIILLLGRIASGIGTSLLFSAPEAWLIGEHQRHGYEAKWLSETFGLADAGDAIVAILAGQLASIAATQTGGPTGPFMLSIGFLIAGALIAMLQWDENTAASTYSVQHSPISSSANSAINTTKFQDLYNNTAVVKIEKATNQACKPTISEAVDLVRKNKRIMLVGAVQALFEGSMYIFVLQWPPIIKAAIQSSSIFGRNAVVPFGIIFSCLMASCLLGATAFGTIQQQVNNILPEKFNLSVEKTTFIMLMLATLSVSSLAVLVNTNLINAIYRIITTVITTIIKYTHITQSDNVGSMPTMSSSINSNMQLSLITAAMFLFEICVGMYFPSIGTLRSKYLPDSHRSVIMNLFGIPLNLIVVTVFLSMRQLGVQGALGCASVALFVATVCMAAMIALPI